MSDPVPTTFPQCLAVGHLGGVTADRLWRQQIDGLASVWEWSVGENHQGELLRSIARIPDHSCGGQALQEVLGGRFIPQDIRRVLIQSIKVARGLTGPDETRAPWTTDTAAMVRTYMIAVETSCFRDEIVASWDLRGELLPEGGPAPGPHWHWHQRVCRHCRSWPPWPQYREVNHLNPCWIRVPIAWLAVGYFPAFVRAPPAAEARNSVTLDGSPEGVQAELDGMAKSGITEDGEVVTINPLVLALKDMEMYAARQALSQAGIEIDADKAGSSDYLNGLLQRAGAENRLPQGAPSKVKNRICSDGSRFLNECLLAWPLKYHSVKDVVRKLSPGCYMAKIDLKAAFLQLRLHPAVRKYYGFRYKGRVRRFANMIFGTSDAPAVCNTMTGMVAGFMEAAQVDPVVMTDDFCIVAGGFQRCLRDFETALQILDELHWRYGKDKLRRPCTALDYLGIMIDAVRRSLSIAAERLVLEEARLAAFLRERYQPRVECEKLAGRLNWLTVVCPRGRPYVSGLYAAMGGASGPRARVCLSEELREDLEWWRCMLRTHVVRDAPLWTRMYECAAIPVIRCISDASPVWGFGVISPLGAVQGQWAREHDSSDSSYLELLALLGFMTVMSSKLNGLLVLFTTDNSSTALAINKGSTDDRRMRQLLKQIAALADQLECVILADHVLRRYLSIPDAMSRGVAYSALRQQALQFEDEGGLC